MVQDGDIMYETFFAERIAALRNKKNVSAREMSLAIGQNESYINRIENKRAFPSMQCFFYICEYLNITPKEFFDDQTTQTIKKSQIADELKSLNDEQLYALLQLIKSFQH